MKRFSEPPDAGNAARADLLAQVQGVLARLRRESSARRKEHFRPDFRSPASYQRSLRPLRRRTRAVLGWPLDGNRPVPRPRGTVRETFAGEDARLRVYRLSFPVLGTLRGSGVFLLPRGEGPFKLVISQHGGQGTPELSAGFFNDTNYHGMSRRLAERGYAVFAPQLLLTWPEPFGPVGDQQALDVAYKQVGASMAALQVYLLQRALDSLLRRPDIVPGGAAMVGLSYGGFYTLALAALDERVRAAVSSCYVNDRFAYPYQDWTWFGSANVFTDHELCALICPRPLYLEAGRNDELFDVAGARKTARGVSPLYRRLEQPECFRFVEHDAGHAFKPGDAPLDFLQEHFLPSP